jgi:uncharacterized protein
MRILLAGGSGLIGSALIRELLAHGHTVTLLSRHPEKLPALPAGCEALRWDGQSLSGWESRLADIEAIVNLAGESIAGARWSPARKHLLRESRLRPGAALLEALRQSSAPRPKIFLQASAVGYYGPHFDEEITEDSPPGDDFLARLCRDWEDSTAAVEELGLRRIVIRTGVVLSADGGALPRLLAPYRFFVGGPLGNGRQWFPWIHRTDEVAAMRFLLENEQARGPFNLSAPQPLTNADFGRVLGRVLRRPSLIPVPAFALRLLFGEMTVVLLEGQRVTPQRLLALGYDFKFPQAEEALRDILL